MKGTYTAVVTPFNDDGKIDFDSLGNLLEKQKNAGITGIIAAGTTGEAATLTIEEKVQLFSFTKQVCPDMEIVAGTGTNNTIDSVKQTEAALNIGIKKVLVVTPYYNKPSCRGLYRHYSEIARTGAKIILYNVPGRTGLNVDPECLARLADIENIVAVKEASGDMKRLAEYIHLVGNKRFDFLSGDDFTVVPFISLGGKGVISVFTNILPELGVAMTNAALEGNFTKAAEIQISITALNYAMFLESNPLPVKTSLSMMKMCRDNFRAPLDKMEEENIAKLSETLRNYNLI